MDDAFTGKQTAVIQVLEDLLHRAVRAGKRD